MGTLCFATNQGLGILAKSFYDHGVVTDPMIVRHGKRKTHSDWYPAGTPQLSGLGSSGRRKAEDFCKKMDVMLFFETPFIWELFPFCREHGVKTVLMPMYECYLRHPPYKPDKFICPSLLDQNHIGGDFIPVPVEVPWRKRKTAQVFVHNAGNGGLKGRNGTKELVEALKYVESPAQFIVRSQGELRIPSSLSNSAKVEVIYGNHPYDTLWDEGDVFVFPERFNGLSLPLQEARAAGMLVIATDRFPINTWLPRDPLIPVGEYRRNQVSGGCLEFDDAIVDPKEIARRIDEWYGKDISDYSENGRKWAESMSWNNLKPLYMEALS